MTDDRLGAAVAAGVLSADATHAELLQSIVDNARAIFGAQAASIMFYDEESHELVFEAVAGAGQDTLVGQRLPAGTGIAGWVLSSGEAMIVEDVQRDPRFARAVAERTGYVPSMLMSAPLLHGEETLGVLNVLDRTVRAHSVGEMELLGQFAGHAAIALSVVRTGRRAKAILLGGGGGGDDGLLVARLAATLDGLDGPRRAAAMRLIQALDTLLRA
jgi:GAF domain-containing protein